MSLTLLDWRRRVASLYRAARDDHDKGRALAAFRDAKNALFGTHAESPIPESERAGFSGLRYAPPDPDLRFTAEVDVDVDPEWFEVTTGPEETSRFRRVGQVRLPVGNLDVFWLETYGGGLFLPFRDATNGRSTYGGGRYLLDTAKGADLGGHGTKLIIDFNYAYHPSCFYDARWTCPLAPAGNQVDGEINAGELA